MNRREHTKFAVLVIVHTQQLSLLTRPELETRDEINALRNNSRHNKRVAGDSTNVGNLNVELLPVVVNPTTVDETSVDAVQTDDVVGTKERIENETDHSTDSVFGEHIERIVNANNELDLGGEVTANTGDHTEDDGCPWRNETGGRSGGHEPRNGTGAPANKRPLLGETEIEETPSHSGEHGSQARVPASHGGTEVSTESRATVEAQPAEPQKDGAK